MKTKSFIAFFIIFFFTQKAIAEITFEQILENPTDLELNLEYARQQDKAGKYKSTIAALERLNLLYPVNTDIKLYLLSVLVRVDSGEKVTELVNDLLKEPNLSTDIQDYLNNVIKEFADRAAKNNQLALGQKKKDWYAFLDLSYNQTEHSNITGLSKSKTFYISDNVSSYASNEIEYDKTYSRSASLTIGTQIDQTSAVNLNLGLNLNQQDKGKAEEFDLLSSSLSYSKFIDKNLLVPYLVYSRPNYRAQNDANTLMIGINNKYIINDQNSLNYGISYAKNKFDQNENFSTANYKNNNTSSIYWGHDYVLTPFDIINYKLFFNTLDANQLYNSYDSYGLSLSYSHIFSFGIFKAERNFQNDSYKAKDTFYNSTIDRSDDIIVSQLTLTGQINNVIPYFEILDKNDTFFYYFNYKNSNINSTLLNYDTKKEYLTIGITKRFNLNE
jgi:hypothetical protein